MEINRRELLAACGASLAFPLPACAAQAVRGQFMPEVFGAVGNGVADDYDAFVRLVQAVNSAGGGSVALTPGRTYFMNRTITAVNGVSGLTFAQCANLTIEGNGATIAVKGDFYRDQQSTRSLPGLIFEDCRNVALRNLRLVGNVNRTSRAASLTESPSHGLIFGGCSDVLVEGITARHFSSDGMYLRQSKRPGPSGTRAACRRFTVRNSRFLFNARQGLSIIQLRGGRFENCDFSYTGYIDETEARGPYGSHGPSAGVDVEPNHTPNTDLRVDVLTGDIQFRNCRMIGNRGTGFVACKFTRRGRFLEQVSLQTCELRCDETGTGRYGFIFDVPDGEVTDCTLQLVNKTAYLGWYRQSDARPRFVGNTVAGRNPGPGHPLLIVRATLGGPVIENNRFIVSGARALSDSNRPSIIVIENPNAIIRNNQMVAGS